MRSSSTFYAAAAVALAASAASADLTFSFADPVPGRQLTHNAGAVSYAIGVPLALLIDGSTEPVPFTTTFNAGLELNLTLGPASAPVGGFSQAPASGTFVLRNLSNPDPQTNIILSGAAESGAFVRIAGTNSILFSHETWFSYAAGPELLALLVPGRTLADPQEAVFTVTDIATGGPPLIPAGGGAIANFTANASFSGNVSVVPTPGALALAGVGGLLALRRRRS